MNGRSVLYVLALAVVAPLAALSTGGTVLGADPPKTRIASKSFTESIILGEMLTLLANQTAGGAEHHSALGGTQIVFQAMEAGGIDAYVEYTGTLSQEILKGEHAHSEDDLRAALKKRGIGMSRPLGFNNTYALGMKDSLAEKLRLKRISDFVQRAGEPEIQRLQFGFSDEFLHRDDGWPTLKKTYALRQTPPGLDHSLAYRGLENGSLHVTDLYSTDAEVRYYKLRLLEDDLGCFPAYSGVILYREAWAAAAPAAAQALLSLEGKINNDAMGDMNARVRLDRDDEQSVAADFLRNEIGLPIPDTDENAWGRVGRDLANNTARHLLLVSCSLLAAMACAVPLGIWAYKYQRITHGILGIVGIVQTIPSMAVLVFMIPLLGLGWKPAVMALFLYSLLPIVRNTYAGLQEIPASLKESALVLGLPPRARLWLIELPLASRSILAGIKTAAVINVGTATIGALVGAGGYGEPILTGIRLANVGLLLQGAVPAAILALFVQGLFELLERWVAPAGLRIKAAT